jgi:hypothetical protein
MTTDTDDTTSQSHSCFACSREKNRLMENCLRRSVFFVTAAPAFAQFEIFTD